jgi:hypothetical protein
MAYSAVSDVQKEFKGLALSGTSNPTDTTVTGWISEADAEIDGRIGTRYQTPVTGTNSLLILKTISIGIVAGRLKEFLKVKAPTLETSQNGRDGNPAKDAREKLGLIAAGDLLLSDASEKSTGEGVSGFTYSNGETATFQKDVESW